MVTQNTSIIITMTTGDRAVNQHCPKGTWDKPIHPHLHRQIQMNTSACAHAKLCTYTPASMHTHKLCCPGYLPSSTVGRHATFCTRTVGWGWPDSSQTVTQQVGAQGPFTTRGPFSRCLKKKQSESSGLSTGT